MISIFGKKFFEQEPVNIENERRQKALKEDWNCACIQGPCPVHDVSKPNFTDKTANNVASRLAPAVQYFVERRLASSDPTFTTAQLLHYVRDAVGHVAPGSPERILRMLRQAGKLNYRVISRKLSKYEATEVVEWKKGPWIAEANIEGEWFPSINRGLTGEFPTFDAVEKAIRKHGSKSIQYQAVYKAHENTIVEATQ